jgi:hypothetical protein
MQASIASWFSTLEALAPSKTTISLSVSLENTCNMDNKLMSQKHIKTVN